MTQPTQHPAPAAPIPVDLPPAEDMTDAAAGGRHCAWCAQPLTLGASVDLGEREADDRRIFPRGCPSCSVLYVYRQLIGHSGACEQCAYNQALCPGTVTLRKALRDAHAMSYSQSSHGR